MKKVIAAVALVTALALTGCGSSSKPAPGEPQVYEAISAETSCPKLQEDFDRNVANHKRFIDQSKPDAAKVMTSYMDAIYKRQEELKCFG